jgi:hypothetical protein
VEHAPGRFVAFADSDSTAEASGPSLKPALSASHSETHSTSGYSPLASETASAAPEPGEPHPAAAPSVRMVNGRRISLNYKINDVGPTGVSAVDLWCTQDNRTWRKMDTNTQCRPPYVVDVNEEGLYGFTIVARNGLGAGKPPPQPGDLPQVWVEVDSTKPLVHLLSADAGTDPRSRTMAIRWTATDKNMAARPITLSYAEQPRGPWTTIVANVENSGRYQWQMPSAVPGKLYVRIEASDLAGNVGLAQSPNAIMLDTSQPTVSILGVEATGR